MNDFTAISQWADGMLALLRPEERRRLATRIGRELRRENQRRIAAQQEPDGKPFAPRKEPLRKNGKRRLRKRGQMFRKLRMAAWLKTRGTPDGATVNFIGAASNIARIHHFGLRDVVNLRKGITHQYAARPLLGITDKDADAIEKAVLQHLGGGD